MVISSIKFKKYLYFSALVFHTACGVTCSLNYTWFQVAFLYRMPHVWFEWKMKVCC